MLDRRVRELDLLRQRYGALEHGASMDWILFRAIPLGEGWNRPTTELLVLIPPAYPLVAPDNFFVREGLRTADGHPPGGYFEGQVSILGPGWAQFSFHALEWRPGVGLTDGDNLVTFMLAVEQRLAEES
jgi:hypothetical protein